MKVCDMCMKKPSAYTTWSPENSETDMCHKCYKLWEKYKQKAIDEAYQKLKVKVRKEMKQENENESTE